MSQVGATMPALIRFGAFEADLRSGELRKSGARIGLQEQPFRVLVLLLQHAGQVVTRDELQQALWPGETFVDFEHGVNVAIARLREALGDEAGRPRFIETLPKRGYRFVAPVGIEPGHTPARRIPVWAAALGIVVLAGGGAAVWRFASQRPPPITDRDTILVADFVNKTGEDVFDGTLRQGLTVQLEQTPFLSIVSRDRVRNTLRQMTRPPDEHLVGDIAREVCRRAGAKASINGSIARLGTRFVLDIEAVTCESGETIASEQVEATDREHVLDALGSAVGPLRQRLGESRPMMRRFDRPLREATTGSLYALQAFTIGQEIRERQGDLPAEPFFKRAIDLDPLFATAHARLSALYGNTFRLDELRRASERAHALRERVTERERLYIDLRYCGVGNLEANCQQNVAEVWKRTYPRDADPYVTLSFVHNNRGNFEAALENGIEAVRLAPDNGFAYGNLIASYSALNRFDEATRVVDAGFARNADDLGLPSFAFGLAFVAGDRRAMARHAQTMNARPDNIIETGTVEADAAAFEGRLNEAGRLWRRAEQVGSEQWRKDVRAKRAMVEAAVGVRREIVDAEFLPDGTAGRDWVIATLLAGDHARTESLLRTSKFEERPPDQRPPYVDRARIFLRAAAGDRAAVDQLPPATLSELRLVAGHRIVYLRGLAYLLAGDGASAAAEFQRIIDHRGIDVVSPLYPLAFVQQARAYALMRDLAKARERYERFFGFWKDADPDVPILKQAKAEYSRMIASLK